MMLTWWGCIASLLAIINWTVACDNGWFGSKCEYKCQCYGNPCSKYGHCEFGSCTGGWFGPLCQYADVAYQKSKLSEITDGNDNTCGPNTGTEIVNIPLEKPYPFTWMRIRVGISATASLLNARVMFRENYCLNCTKQRKAWVDEKTLDIYCDLNEMVQFVTVIGIRSQDVCSVYISGGRNVAVKQNTSQSSTYSFKSIDYTSDKAVDGNTNGNFLGDHSCSHTAPYLSHGNWSLTFSAAKVVNRYLIYNRNDFGHRLSGFTLQSYGPNGTKVVDYKDFHETVKPIFSLAFPGSGSLVSRVDIQAGQNENILTLCEVEIYGESHCDAGRYGLYCDRICNCKDCFVATGGCPSGCPAGRTGEACELSCNSGFFGLMCQYMYRCSWDYRRAYGLCYHGYACLGGWFGPACQYADLAYQRSKISEITDGNDTTCGYHTGTDVLLIPLAKPYPFTWMRIRVKISAIASLENITIIFREPFNVNCENQRKAWVDENTLDIHCNNTALVKTVTVVGVKTEDLCSVYISGGRNVALKQPTSQSSNYWQKSYVYSSEKAVDGYLNPNFPEKTCSHTAEHQNYASWSVTLYKPKRVNRYLIYNRQNYGERLSGFTLQMYQADGFKVFDYKENIKKEAVYSHEFVGAGKVISRMDIQARQNEYILTLCEVEIYGDSECEAGQYGRDCEHRCNCAGGEPCFVSTGGCPSGCPDGYAGEACNKPCSPDKYGIDCKFTCSKLCWKPLYTTERVCDPDGSCLLGCVSGYTGLDCSTACGVSGEGDIEIAGGYEPANDCELPWTAIITSESHYCFGVILDDDDILTEASCVDFRGQEVELAVWVGPSTERQRYDVETVFKYTAYDKKETEKDVAVLKLVENMPLSKCLHPICLPSASVRRPDDYFTSFHRVFPESNNIYNFNEEWMRTLPVADSNICDRYKSYIKPWVASRMVCAESSFNDIGCRYISAGPLIGKLEERYMLFGIGYTSRCVNGSDLTAYIRISDQHLDTLNFIRKAMNTSKTSIDCS